LSKFVLPILRATELSTTIDNKFQPIMINLGSGINPELSNGANDN